MANTAGFPRKALWGIQVRVILKLIPLLFVSSTLIITSFTPFRHWAA